MKQPTLNEVLKDVYVDGGNVLIAKKRGERIPKVLDGLKPKARRLTGGLHTLTPEELLNLRVEPVQVNGRVEGYQREPNLRAARKGAQALRDGKRFRVIEVSTDGKGRGYISDGQHRAIAAIMARVPVDVVVRKASREERAELFHSQRYSRKISNDVLVLAGTGPAERYIQQTIAEPAKNPWGGFVSTGSKAKTRISPNALFNLLVRYVGDREGTAAGHRGILVDAWDRGLADELAPLIRCFGNKQTNPAAFRGPALQGIGSAAMWVFRRNEPREGDYERWQQHMPKFPFDLWPHLRSQRQFTEALLAHWNKGLRGKRRVHRA